MCPAQTFARAVKRRSVRKQAAIFGDICPSRWHDTDRSGAYVLRMLSTLLVIGGVLVGLLVLLALIVSLSARPQTRPAAARSWVADAGRPHPDAWSPLTTTATSEMPAVR